MPRPHLILLPLLFTGLSESAQAQNSVFFGPNVVIDNRAYKSGPIIGNEPGDAQRRRGPLHCRAYGNGTDTIVEGKTETCAMPLIPDPPGQ